MKIEYEGVCYVLVHTNAIHPMANARHDLLWYPERGMTLLDQVEYRPYVKSIVTESPWLIGCYDRENVRVWKESKWRMPNYQTYGADTSSVYSTLLGIRQSIPSTPLDSGERIRELRKELEASYREA